jgi:hypothetical protein
LSRAYNEYKSSNNQSNNSWYINLLFSVKNWILTYLFAKKLVKINLNCVRRNNYRSPFLRHG